MAWERVCLLSLSKKAHRTVSGSLRFPLLVFFQHNAAEEKAPYKTDDDDDDEDKDGDNDDSNDNDDNDGEDDNDDG